MSRSLSLLLLLSSLAASAAAQTDAEPEPTPPMVVSTGTEGGGYWGIGTRLAEAVKRHGGSIDVRPSQGSMENLKRLDAPVDPTAIALTQADALAWYLQQQPVFAGDYQQVETIGRECVFLITAADSGIDSLADLETAGHRLAIPGESSGVAVTFKAMQSMQPGLSATEAVYISPQQAMLELAKPAGQRQVDALMLVHRPKIRSGALKQAIYESDKYGLATINPDNLDARLPNGQPVYTPLKLPLLRDNWTARKTLDTVCMEGLLLSAPQKLSSEQAAILKRTIDFNWMQIYAEPLR